jgi:flagellin
VLQTQSQNTASAESTIRDANFAEEVANLTKFQILAQSGLSALAQANSSSQSVLSLLRG